MDVPASLGSSDSANWQVPNADAMLGAVLNTIGQHVALICETGNIIAVNDAWRRFAQENNAPDLLSGPIGMNYLKVCELAAKSGHADSIAAAAGIREVMGGNKAQFQLDYACHSPTKRRWFRMRVKPLVGSRALLIVHEDVTLEKVAELRNEQERAVLEYLAGDHSLVEHLSHLVRSFESQFDGMRGSVLILDPTGRRLLHGAAPSLPAEYCAAIDGIEIGPSAGSCGAAAHLGQTIIVSDIAAHPLWRNYKDQALPHGLRACWSMPIRGSQGRVLGTFALYFDAPREADSSELAFIERGAWMASLAISRHLSEGRFRAVIEASPVPMAINDSHLQITYLNPAFVSTFGYTLDDIPTLGEWWPRAYPDSAYRDWVARTWTERLEQARLSGKPFEPMEATIRAKDGTQRSVIATAAAFSTGLEDEHCVVIVDVTQRKKMEADLQASKEFNIAVLDSLSKQIVVVDNDGFILSVNEAWRTFMRQVGAPESIVNPINLPYATVRSVAHASDDPEIEKEIFDRLRKILSGQKADCYLEYASHAGGDIRWFGLRVTRLNLPGTRAVVSHQDITTRQLSIQAKEESDRYLRAFADRVPALIGYYDHNLINQFANAAYMQWVGRSWREVKGMHVRDLIGPELYATNEPSLLAVLRGEPQQFERTIRMPGAEPMHVIISYVPDVVAGEVKGFFVISLDITARKVAEQGLLESYARFETLANATFEGVMISQDLVIIDCNKQMEKVTGYSRDELIGRPFDFFTISNVDEVRGKILEGVEIQSQQRGRRKDGTIFDYETHGRTVRQYGRDVRITAVRDNTARIRMERIAVQTDKMTAIGGLAAGIAHEINTPLAIIIQNLETMINRINPDDATNQAEAAHCGTTMDALRNYMQRRDLFEIIQSALRAGDRAAVIVRSMLAFSRPRSDTMELHPIDTVIDQAWELAKNDSQMTKSRELKRLKFIRDSDPQLPQAPCHPSELQQVLLNLFRNAIQAIESSPRPDAVPCIVVRTRLEGVYVRIDVEDNGPGIHESIRHHVFEPFFTTKPVGVGTGLGLFVSYFIICDSHRGKLSLGNGTLGGASFEIRIPIRPIILIAD